MKKHEIIAAVSSATGYSNGVIREIFDAATTVARDAIARHEEVLFLGVGKLSIRRRGARTARDMVTGAPMRIPPRNVVAFRPSDSFSAAANADE